MWAGDDVGLDSQLSERFSRDHLESRSEKPRIKSATPPPIERGVDEVAQAGAQSGEKTATREAMPAQVASSLDDFCRSF
jgi:hypothetical protein